MAFPYSIIHWFPDVEKHKCGYCKQLDKNCNHGMWAESMTVEDYQNLIDRGWRRSGKYCYKPVMDITCCPLYTIRCEALDFKISKSQKKIIKRVNRFLSESVEEKTPDDVQMQLADQISEHVFNKKSVRKVHLDQIKITDINIVQDEIEKVTKTVKRDFISSNEYYVNNSGSLPGTSNNTSDKNYKPGIGADISKPPCKKAKLLRLERKQQKLAAKGILNSTPMPLNISQGKTLEQFIKEIQENPVHQLKVKLVYTGPDSDQWEHARSQEYQIYCKYQMTIHGDPLEKCTEKDFTRFLFDSPLQRSNPSNGPSDGYGSFHQQYWIDNKLIAVGVIDILPKCVSSVYFFYDPDYRHLTLGTYGSLRELYFTRDLHKSVPNIKYYYMGYYIHSCPKMRYKANLSPSYLLCPETYVWLSIEHCLKKLDKNLYCRFNDDNNAIDEYKCSTTDLDQLLVMVSYTNYLPFKYLKKKLAASIQEYKLFGNLVGKKCIKRMLLVSKDIQF